MHMIFAQLDMIPRLYRQHYTFFIVIRRREGTAAKLSLPNQQSLYGYIGNW